MTVTFTEPQFSMSRGKIAPSAHVVALVDTNGDRQKWRCCLTMNDDGTWQWAPGPPAEVAVPEGVANSITSTVASHVALYGIDRPDPE